MNFLGTAHLGDPVVNAQILITGAASGMGALYAKRALRGGAKRLLLVDVNREGLASFVTELEKLRAPHQELVQVVLNLADPQTIEATVADLLTQHGCPDIVINNAGIVFSGSFWEHSPQQITDTMAVNSVSPMLLTQLLLPHMIADRARPKRILNIASAAGTLANPNMSVYAASKWALVGWSDSVRLELEKYGHEHVRVTTFCPSYVSTGMFAGARGPLLTPILTPKQAVRAAWQGMLAGKPFVLRPWSVKLGMILRGVLPVRVWDLLAAKVLKVYSSMDEFTGRQR